MIHSPPTFDQPSIALPAPSSAELEQLRQQSIQVLAAVADALEAAGQQRESLVAEVQTAQRTLQQLVAERELAEANLAVTRSQLAHAASQLELTKGQQVGILSELEKVVVDGLQARAALEQEVAALERHRAELAPADIPDTGSETRAALQQELAALRQQRDELATLVADSQAIVAANVVSADTGHETRAALQAELTALARQRDELATLVAESQAVAATLLDAGLESRAALHEELSALERQRDELATLVAESQVVAGTLMDAGLQNRAALQAEVAALERQRNELIADSQAMVAAHAVLVDTGQETRTALQAELAALERQRDELATLVAESQVVAAALLDTGLESRAALQEEVAALDRQRNELATLMAESQVVAGTLLDTGLESRAALQEEVAGLERQRDDLARLVTEAQAVVSGTAHPDSSAAGLASGAVVGHADPPVQLAADSPAISHPAAPTAADSTAALLAELDAVLTACAGHHPGLPKPAQATPTRPTRPAATGSLGIRLRRLARPINPGFSNIATAGLITLLFGLALLLTPLTQVFGGLQLLAVMSGSMEPTIPVGGIVGIRPVPATDLKVGDAITFVNQSNPDVLVTHRVVSLEVRDGQTMLTTKGDANNSVDALSAPASRAVGRVEFSLPWLGYLMVWMSAPLAKIGIVALAVLGLGLTSVKRSSAPVPPAAPTETTFVDYEREIQALLGPATPGS